MKKKVFIALIGFIIMVLLVSDLCDKILTEESEEKFSCNLLKKILVEKELGKAFWYGQRKKIASGAYAVTTQYFQQLTSNKLWEILAKVEIDNKKSFNLYYFLTKSSKSPPLADSSTEFFGRLCRG